MNRAYTNAYYRAHREKIIEQRANYRRRNREKIAAYQRAWYRANKEKVLAYKRGRYQEIKKKPVKQPAAEIPGSNNNHCRFCGAELPKWGQYLSYCDKICYLEAFKTSYGGT